MGCDTATRQQSHQYGYENRNKSKCREPTWVPDLRKQAQSGHWCHLGLPVKLLLHSFCPHPCLEEERAALQHTPVHTALHGLSQPVCVVSSSRPVALLICSHHSHSVGKDRHSSVRKDEEERRVRLASGAHGNPS